MDKHTALPTDRPTDRRYTGKRIARRGASRQEVLCLSLSLSLNVTKEKALKT